MSLCECGCGQTTTFYMGQYRRFISGHNNKGEKNNFWNGGRSTSNEYILIKDSNHPNCNKQGYVPEHVKIFTKYYKVCMLKWSIIHHKNGDKKDNSIQNLESMMRSTHLIIHNPLQYRKYEKLDTSDWFCKICGADTTYTDKQGKEHWFGDDINGHKCRKCYRKERWKNTGRN